MAWNVTPFIDIELVQPFLVLMLRLQSWQVTMEECNYQFIPIYCPCFSTFAAT